MATCKKRLIHNDEIARFIPELQRSDAADGRNDNGVFWFREHLETRLAKVYQTERPQYQFANQEILPVRGTVPARDGEMGFYYMWDHEGVAKWLSAGSGTDIPTVSLKRDRKTFTVHRAALGWQVDMDDIERARERDGASLEFMNMEAAAEGLDSQFDDAAFAGDSVKGFPGFTTIPNMTVVIAAAGNGGAYRWSTLGATAKTTIEAKQDVDLLRRIVRAVTKNLHDINYVWLPPSFWERTTSLFIANTSKTLREHLLESFPGVTFKEVRRLENAGQYNGPVIMAAKITTEEDCWIERPDHLVPGLTVRVGETIKGYLKTSHGGVVCVYPLRFVRMDFPAD